MKKKNHYLELNKINFAELINKFFKEKILILFFSVGIGVLGYLSQFFSTKEFKTEITINKPTSNMFIEVVKSLEEKEEVADKFFIDLKSNILSLDNLDLFIQQNKDIENFKLFLKKRKITTQEYFYEKFGDLKKRNKIIENKFFLIFPKELQGSFFLNNYIEFTANKTINETGESLKLKYLVIISKYQEALEIAKMINLENPIFCNEDLFFKGTKLLNQEILNYKKLLAKLEDTKIIYNPIYSKASNIYYFSTPSYLYGIFGFFLGFFLSLIIIFFKNILR